MASTNVLPPDRLLTAKPSDLRYLSHQHKQKAKQEIEYAAVRAGQIRPWMKKLAEWAVTQDVKKIPYRNYADMATKLAGCKIAVHAIRLVIQNEQWQAYKESVAADVVGNARRILESRVAEYADTHYKAMLSARGKVADDPMTAAKITEPVLDRIWPKKEQGDGAPTTVVINLAPNQKVQEVVEYEVLPCEVVENTG